MKYNTDGDVIVDEAGNELRYNSDGDLLPYVEYEQRAKPYIQVNEELHDLIESIGKDNVLEILKKEHPEFCV